MAADSEFARGRPAGVPAGHLDTHRLGLAVEIGDWHRLDGRRIGAYLGMVPTEHSSGGSRSLGGITKTATPMLVGC